MAFLGQGTASWSAVMHDIFVIFGEGIVGGSLPFPCVIEIKFFLVVGRVNIILRDVLLSVDWTAGALLRGPRWAGIRSGVKGMVALTSMLIENLKLAHEYGRVVSALIASTTILCRNITAAVAIIFFVCNVAFCVTDFGLL